MAEETELKLRVTPADAPRLQAALTRLAQTPPVMRHLLSLYFDTPGLDLLRQGWALRVRRVGRHWLQTLKGGGGVVAGLHQRQEFECRLPRPQPDPTPVVALLPGFAPDGLTSVFRADFRRRLWQFRYRGAQVEAAFDRGRIVCGDEELALLELELELRSGPVVALYDLALELAQDCSLAPEPRSKAERGYALFQGRVLEPAKAQPVRLRSETSVEDAFVLLANQCLEQIERNQAGVLETADAEFLHQMRVGLRRLRALFSLFRPVLGKATLEPWREPLARLAAVVGAARDWDVLEEELLPQFSQALAGNVTLAELSRRIRRRRRSAWQQARKAVASPQYGQLTLGLGRWLANRDWRATDDADQRARLDTWLRAQAASWLNARHKKLLKRGRHLGRLDDGARHALRIQVKKMRYAAEFLGSLFPEAAVRPYVKRLAALQATLGRLNDLITAVAHVEALCGRARTGHCREDAALFTDWAGTTRAQALAALPREWKRLRHCPPFWKG
ncbi:CHAD domain-containing protein [Thiobacter aerophilum]|uniref:CHAD domain-containing protein n=1 Tax=Thiobacter aerophilum TaxID=3121275 RepID=A0ABV0EGN0_9BURK